MNFVLVILLSFAVSAAALAQSQFSLQPKPVAIAAPAALTGTWGTDRQCATFAAGGSDNPALMPYQISSDWVKQGFLYCFLSWRGETRVGGQPLYYAEARCGEDDLRDYRLSFELRDKRLRIYWSEDFTTAALEACRVD